MIRKFTLGLVLLLLAGNFINAQTETNREALNQIAQEQNNKWFEQKQRVDDYAKENNLPIYFINELGQQIQMVDVIDGMPQYYATFNLGAAHTTRASELWTGSSTGLNMDGDGYDQLGEWDGGKVLISHQEFTDQGASRVAVMDGNHATSDHSTHVAGTLVAAGVKAQAKGMAYKATLKSWEWTNDESEMATAASNGLEISNHSYGFLRGWYYDNGSWHWAGNSNISPDEDYRFGYYNSDSRTLDNIAYNAPDYLIVRAAGNDRGEGPSDAGNGKAEKDGGDDGYDCIGTEGVAKNILTVGAVREVWPYTGPESVVMSDFSCWGPADDGRIKPDVVAKGVDVYSSIDISNSSYASYNGTSMASPNAAGTLALLQYYFQQSHNSGPIRAATLKGLTIHTADEAGPFDGPDYMFGWGLINAERASSVITDDLQQDVLEELVLQNNDEYVRNLTVPEGKDLKVTISWTDKPGNPANPQLDPIDPMLVNDLDLHIEGPDGTSYYPWRLDRDNPAAAAVRNGTNNVDNVEVVFVENPGAGVFTVHVDHKGTLSGGSQAFSLIISGIDEYQVTPDCAEQLKTPQEGSTDVILNQYISWKPANFATSYDVYFGSDGDGINTPVNVYNGENFTSNGFTVLMQENTTYYLQVVPRNNQGAAVGCNTIWSFTTMTAITSFPYVQDVEAVITPQLPEFWQAYNNSDVDWFSNSFIANSGSNSMACFHQGGLEQVDMDNWLVSPPFRVETGKEYLVSFYLMNFVPSQPEKMSLYWGYAPFVDSLTNLMWEDSTLALSSFNKFQSLYVPEEDSIVYFGWHYNTSQGYGVFMDDMMVENWGAVGVSENSSLDDPNVYFVNKEIVIITDENWDGANIQVLNLLGQPVYTGELNNTLHETIRLNNLKEGMYLVNLTKNNHSFTRKVILK